MNRKMFYVAPYIPVHVPVETIVVGDQLVLSLVVELALEIHMLENWKIWLVSRQREGSNINQTLLAIVVKDLKNIVKRKS